MPVVITPEGFQHRSAIMLDIIASQRAAEDAYALGRSYLRQARQSKIWQQRARYLRIADSYQRIAASHSILAMKWLEQHNDKIAEVMTIMRAAP